MQAIAAGCTIHAGGDEQSSRILFRNQDLFLTRQIEVGVTTGRARNPAGSPLGTEIFIVMAIYMPL